MPQPNRFRRPLAALAALSLLAPLAACADDRYGPGPGPGYGGQYAPPPPPPPPGYDDRQGGPPPGYYGDRYGDRNGAPPPPPPGDYDPQRDYRARPGYDRAMTRDDTVYRGRDGHYYCRRSDGTTGTVVGAVAGGALGAILGGGGLLGTILGAGGGALLGRSVDQGQIRCR